MTETPLYLKIHRNTLRGGVELLELQGEADVGTSRLLDAAVHELKGSARVLLDLTGITVIDATGIGRIISLKKGVGDLKIVCNNQTILRIFKITRLDRVFTIYGSRELALDSWQ
jgi:anti-sigma B factor antagonist